MTPARTRKAALALAALWWLAVGLEVGVVGHTPGLAVPDAFGFTFTGAGVGVHLTLVAIITAAVAALWFRRGRPALREALAAAATVVAVSLALDAAITVPLAVKSYGHYFGKATLWAGLAWTVAVFTATAMRPRRRAPEATRSATTR
jgi:hypothetical protein